MREIYLKQETIFNQMCEEVFDAVGVGKDVFLDSQQAYMKDSGIRREVKTAI